MVAAGFGVRALAALSERGPFGLGGADRPGCVRAPNLSRITKGRPGSTWVRPADVLLNRLGQ